VVDCGWATAGLFSTARQFLSEPLTASNSKAV
jgi:hypothetical protein